MKFLVAKDRLLEALQKVQSVVGPRPTLPILSNVLIQATPDAIHFTTSNLDIFIRCSIPAQDIQPGSTTLPAKKLSSIVKELPAKDVLLESDSSTNTTLLRSGGTRFRLYGLPGEDFPPLPDIQHEQEFRIPQKQLQSGLHLTSYAISLEESRFVLNGIYFRFANKTLTMVATDGRRLALYEFDSDFPFPQERDFILPSKSIEELERLVEDKNEVVIRAAKNLIAFEFDSVLFITRRIDGNYPNYRHVIPDNLKHRAKLERKKFLESIHRVSLMDSEGIHSVRLSFSPDELELQLNAPEVGEAQESLTTSFQGDPLTICFSPKFLMDPLRNLDDDEIVLEMLDPLSAGIIRPEPEKLQERFLYVIMPMNPDGSRS